MRVAELCGSYPLERSYSGSVATETKAASIGKAVCVGRGGHLAGRFDNRGEKRTPGAP